jgi:hypothetical protein
LQLAERTFEIVKSLNRPELIFGVKITIHKKTEAAYIWGMLSTF